MSSLRPSVLQLSRGSVWKPWPAEPPYLTADPGDPWDESSDAWVVFTDTSGNTLSQLYADSVTPNAINFVGLPTDVDSIPAGANFEVFIDSDDGPVKIRYGKVIRREVEFFDAPVNQTTVALNYTDTFPTLGLRSNWVSVTGRTTVYGNGTLPNAVSANAGLFFSQSAIRWDTALNSDTIKSHVTVLNQGQGLCHVIICADQRFTSGLAVSLDAFNNQIHMGSLSGPTTIVEQVAAISHVVHDLDDYTVTYDNTTKVLAVYQGSNLTPLLTWTDSLDVVPHGPGYRYAGFSFDTGFFFQPGIEVSSWQAKDN